MLLQWLTAPKKQVLPLCEGDAQEASMLSRIREGRGGRGLVAFYVVDKNPLHVAIDISTPVDTSSRKKEKKKYLIVYIFLNG